MSAFAATPPQDVRVIGEFAIGKTLGSGMSAKVKLGTHLSTGEQVALKLIDRTKLTPRQVEMLEREIQAMQAVQHPNTLLLRHVEWVAQYPKKRGGFREVVLLVLELGTGGELFDYLMYTGPLGEQVARSYFRQLLSALEVCHSQGVYHRDLKPENLLLDGSFQLKLADFGLAAINCDDHLCATECGTRSYMAPEVMSRQSYDGAKADIWSSGVVLFIMLAGNPPFAQAGGNDWWFTAIRHSRYDKFWMAHLRSAPDFPKLAQEFLNRIFVADSANRASIDELWQHPWLQGAVLQPHELGAAMEQKRQTVQRTKERELAAAKAKKAREKARAGAARGGAYDPFGQQVMRGGPKPPIAGPSGLTYFYSHVDPEVALKRLAKAFGDLQAAPVSVKDEDFKVKATLPRETGPLSVVARVLSVDEEGELLILDLERRSGDQLDFVKLVQTELAGLLKDVVEADSDKEELVAAAAGKAEAAGQEVEELIADNAAEDVF